MPPAPRAAARRRPVRLVAASLASLALLGAAPEDDWLAGYAAAAIERDLGLEVVSLEVERGVARVVLRQLSGQTPERVAATLARIDGIERAEVSVAGDGEGVRALEAADPPDEGSSLELLPRRELFDPILADPRQPHFSASYLWYLDDPEATHVGSANFGETFALLGGELEGGARWEIGLLGAVFSIFDLDTDSFDLINSDFWVAPTFSLRGDRLSAQLRVYHQSSHLGDEFLLRNRTQRVNLSYEGVDLITSADLHPSLRVYAGGGVIVHDEPDLDPLSVQAGAELKSPVALFGDSVRPLAAADLQFRQETDWKENIAVVAGIQLENPDVSALRVQLLGEYYTGKSPNGQFFQRRIEYVGFGVHLHF